MADKLVKVTKLGDRVQEFSLANGSTVDEMLEKAGLAGQPGIVKINGVERGSFTRALQHGDIITLTPQVKGGVLA